MAEAPIIEGPHPPFHHKGVRRIIFKLKDSVPLPRSGNMLDGVDRAALGELVRRLDGEASLQFTPAITAVPPEVLRSIGQHAMQRAERRAERRRRPPCDYQLARYLAIEVSPAKYAKVVQEEVSQWAAVEFAYLEPRRGPPPCFDYLGPPHLGIGLYYNGQRIGYPGNHGGGIKFADVEGGWKHEHEDFPEHELHLPICDCDACRRHGRFVVGIVAGKPHHGYLSMAPNAEVHLIGTGPCPAQAPDQDPGSSIADGVARALTAIRLGEGDVLLIEQQIQYDDLPGVNLPPEADPLVHATIGTACDCGVIVVEPAGTNDQGKDLDNVNLPDWGGKCLRRDAREQVAIMVAAGRRNQERAIRSNYGSRVDFFARGDDSVQLLTSTSGYKSVANITHAEPDTSWSAALIAGAAVCTQGMYVAHKAITHSGGPPRLELEEMLAHLHVGATPHQGGDLIGDMPDLKAVGRHIW